MEFVSLHNQTDFSILDSVCSVKGLINRAKELGQSAIAITEHGSFASAWDAWKISKAAGVKLITGCELYFRNNLKDESERMSHILLLAKNQVGYQNILTLNKLGFDSDSKVGKRVYPVIDWDLLEKHSDGVICLTACGNGIISQLVMKREFDTAEEVALRLKKIFGDNLGLEVQPNNMVRNSNVYNDEIDQKFINHRLINLGDKLGIRVVAACNTHYLKKEDYKTHDVFLAIGSRQPIFSSFRLRYPVPDFYLKSGDEVKAFFSRNYGESLAEQLCLNSLYFASLCEEPEWIDPKYSNPSGKELPIFPVKDEPDYEEFKSWVYKQKGEISLLDEDKQYLRYSIDKHFPNKISKIAMNKIPEYLERIAEELDVLEYHGFSSYMLIVADYINWAKKNGIAVGAGRGCLSAEGKILTENGYKNIIDINIGDKVYSHTGKLRDVIDIHAYDCNEDCVSIKTSYSFENLVFTDDHKLFAIKQRFTDEYKKANEKTRKKVRKYDYLDDPSWIAVKDLKIGDFIFMPYVSRDICKENVPSKFSIKTSSTRNSKLDIVNTINVDSDFIYFLGRWVGDGWITTHNSDSYDVGLAFNSNDIESINWFVDYLGKFFNVSVQKHKTKNLVQIVVHNKSLFDIISNIFPYYNKSSSTKHLPVFFRDLSNDNLRDLLCGYIDSDGSVEKQYHSNTFRYNIDSTSKRLIFEIRELLNFLKIKSYVSVRKPFMKYDKVKKYSCKESYKLRFLDKPDIDSEGYVVQIKSLDKIKCNKVYDITVEKDHSYVTQNFAAHNSVGGSLIAYILGIHDADPIKYGLIFARFHNKEKSSFPDIDTDFAPSGRALVQDYLRRKYGEDHVAHVSNVNTITPKVYVRDIARACELGGSKEAAVQLGNDVADCIPADIKSIDSALEKVPLFAEYCKKYPEFIEHKDICGKYRAWSTHAGGIIISQRPLTGLIPLRRDKDGSLAIEYDKEKAEENGLVKMDTLGLSTLDTISKTLDLIKKLGKEVPKEMYDYDNYDKDTYDLISNGDTFKVFQLGTSGGTIDLCKNVKPVDINDIANINALARPSARDMRDDFIKTKNGEREMTLLHPSLERGFGQTYGFGLYEECLMYLAQDVAGWTLHGADRLRKLTKAKGKYPEKAKAWRKEFLDGGKNNNIDPSIVKRIWDEVVEKFQGYGFNKSLSVFDLIDIYSSDGTYLCTKEIGAVLPGDHVKSRDEKTKQDIFVQVLNNHDHGVLPLVEVELTTGEKIRCTMNHKFRVEESGEMLPLHQILKEELTIIVDIAEKNSKAEN